MDKIEELLKEKNEILTNIALLYKEESKLEKRIEVEFKKIKNIESLLSKYDYDEDDYE